MLVLIFKPQKTIKHSLFAELEQDMLAGSAAIPGSPPGNPTFGADHAENVETRFGGSEGSAALSGLL
jgi:hypothetical protein